MVANYLLLFVAAVCSAHDAVIFSYTTNLNEKLPSLANLVEVATPDAPILFLLNPDFTLGQFSQQAGAYQVHPSVSSSIVNAAKGAKSKASRYLDSNIYVEQASIVNAASPFHKGSSVYVITGDNWSSLEQAAVAVLSQLGSSATAIILSDSDLLSAAPVRVKRVSTSAGAGANGGIPFPLLMPPLNMSEVQADKRPCLLYLEGLNIVVQQASQGSKPIYATAILRDNGSNGTTWQWDNTYLNCSGSNVTKEAGKATSTFEIRIDSLKNAIASTKEASGTAADFSTKGPFHLKLTTALRADGYWDLESLELLDAFDISLSKGAAISVTAGPVSSHYIGMGSVFSYGWNCHNTQAAFFKTKDATYQVGISFHNIQIQVNAHDSAEMKGLGFFTRNIDSCTGTFSSASWMGIITALVLVAVFLFGFLMLNSVQTMDRFDDPKQKQININVRE